MSGTVIFLLSPRLIDLDTFLPVAMEIKAKRPDLTVRFVTFSLENAAYIRRNTTLMSGIDRCAELHAVGARDGAGILRRLAARLSGFATVASWIVGGKRPILFCGNAYVTVPYLLWYALARLRGGRGYVLFKGRAVDDGIQLVSRDRLAELPQGAQGWFGRLFGIRHDGLIHYHEQQESYLYGLGLAGRERRRPAKRLKIGLPTLTESWQDLIAEQTRVERARLTERGHKLDGHVVAFFPAKAGSGRNLADAEAPARTFRQIVEALAAIETVSLVLIRLHPLAQNDPFVFEALDRLDDRRFEIVAMHPEVMIELADRAIVNAPTNIQTTSYKGRFIDCTDYSDRHRKELGPVSLAAGYATTFADPRDDDFARNLGAAIETDTAFADPDCDAVRRALVAGNPPDFDALIDWIDLRAGRV